MKHWFLSGAIAVSGIASASAADIYAPSAGGYKDAYVAPNTWTGFYTGFNGGYAFSNNNDITYYFQDPVAGTRSGNIKFAKASPEGGFGGTQGGYNWQSGSLVYGIETDVQVGDISASSNKLNPFNTLDTYGYKTQLNWFGTVRGRIGYSFGPALVYATGGFAYGQIQNEVSYTSTFPKAFLGPNGIATGKNSKTETEGGYVVGGGLEYSISPKWSIKAEYQYIDLGTTNVGTNYCFGSGCTTNELHAKFDNTFDVVSFGLNYHVGADYQPLK